MYIYTIDSMKLVEADMNCLFDLVSNVWLLLYESVWMSNVQHGEVRESLTRSKMVQELENIEIGLVESEKKLVSKVAKMRSIAMDKKKGGDLIGAKRKLRDSLTAQNQLDKVRTSLGMIASQLSTISNTELNSSLFSILKLSNDAMGRLTGGGVSDKYEDMSISLQENLQKASEMNDIMSAPMQCPNGFQEYSEAEMDEELENLWADDALPSHVPPIRSHAAVHNEPVPKLDLGFTLNHTLSYATAVTE
jgi:hypothetical protein